MIAEPQAPEGSANHTVRQHRTFQGVRNGKTGSQASVFPFPQLGYSKHHSNIIYFSFPWAQCQAIMNPESLSVEWKHSGPALQSWTVYRAVLQEGEKSDTKNSAPRFYLLHSLNCSDKRDMAEKSFAVTLLLQSPSWLQHEVSDKTTNVQDGYCQQQTTWRKAGKSRRIILRMMRSGDRLFKIASESSPKWNAWLPFPRPKPPLRGSGGEECLLLESIGVQWTQHGHESGCPWRGAVSSCSWRDPGMSPLATSMLTMLSTWHSTSGLRQEGTRAASLHIYPDQKKQGRFSASTENTIAPGLQVEHVAAFDERQNRHHLYLHTTGERIW